MNPMICYFYEYKNHNRIRTVGFAKIKQRYRTILVEMYLKGVLLSPDEALTVHAFYKDNADTIKVPLLTLKESNPNFHCRFTFQETQLPQGRTLAQMDGLLLTGPGEELFVAAWMNVTIDPQRIRLYASEPSESVMARSTADDSMTSVKTSALKTSGNNSQNSQDSLSPALTNIVEAAAFCEAPAPEPASPPASAPGADLSCQKISRRDISQLPRNCWALANNSFLIHGFHNYHHLLLMEKEGHLWLGVPGIRDEKEERAASMFGFPTFQQEALSSLALLPEERNDSEIFGYWCHKIN